MKGGAAGAIDGMNGEIPRNALESNVRLYISISTH